MEIDIKKLKSDESRSNPMAVAMVYQDCPINRPCFWIVVGFGTPAEICEYFKDESTETMPKAECKKMEI